MDRWRGKVAIVTGASVGIGAAICYRLVEEGCLVVGLARRVEMVQQHAKGLQGKRGKLYAYKADLTVEEDIIKAFKWTLENVGPVHILVNNAGTVTGGTDLISGDTAKWRTVMDTNVIGLCIATREAIQIMKKRNIEGHIIHINSVTGHSTIYIPKINVYGASKYAVTNLAETLRKELIAEKINIKVSSVSPGLVDTAIIRHLCNDRKSEQIVDEAPKLESEDVADSVAYILSTPPNVHITELMIRPFGELF
ncbi:PREDICTED: farnesol dehydrogenase-like [Nicrophorus vespilloides]|uniref:Farnesol dehydrogenase-like n=1 Tax=Nicrophorus vespilloides TaxID=110193 RepID=A0ABM1MS40_NICVS|nr:PREDICTED: farnesol dehydrogenase-like [Nicrophorus vespilloides]